MEETKMRRKIRKIASILYVVFAIVLVYIGFVGAELDRMEVSIPSIIGMIVLLVVRYEIAKALKARAKRKLWLKKYQ